MLSLWKLGPDLLHDVLLWNSLLPDFTIATLSTSSWRTSALLPSVFTEASSSAV